MPDLHTRAHKQEIMDDFAIIDARLERALEDLSAINRWLGGYATTMAALKPFLRKSSRRSAVRVLDLGAGAADFPEHLVRWADTRGLDVRVTALDANPATVTYARARLDRRLPPPLRAKIHVETGDALDPGYEEASFDVVLAALFMHHLEDEQAVRLLRTMQRLARHGLIVNDLHRHPLAYYGILALTKVLPISPMVANDGPLSVRRGFRREELARLADAAGLSRYRLRWHWAFRWELSTL